VNGYEVRLLTDCPGMVNDSVSFRVLGEHGPPRAVGVVGRVTAAVEATPAKLMLPRPSASGPVYYGTCLIHAPAGGQVVIVGSTAPGGMNVDVQPGDTAGPRIVRISWDPSSGRDLAGTDVTVRLRVRAGEAESTLDLPVTCLRGAGG
jgi:hypothetical protein